MKKNIFLVGLLCITNLIFTQDIEWQLIDDSKAYEYTIAGKYIYERDIPKETIVTPLSYGALKSEDLNDYMVKVSFQNSKYRVFANKVIPFGTSALLSKSILTTSLIQDEKAWFNADFLKIIKSKDRNAAYKIYKKGIEDYIIFAEDDIYLGPWWDPGQGEINTKNDIFNTFIYINLIYNSISFIIKDIELVDMNYKIKALVNHNGLIDNYLPDSMNIEIGRKLYTDILLTLKPDGDYLDIYFRDINEKEHFFTSLVKMDKDFGEVFEEFLKTNKTDLSSINWPKRASQK